MLTLNEFYALVRLYNYYQEAFRTLPESALKDFYEHLMDQDRPFKAAK